MKGSSKIVFYLIILLLPVFSCKKYYQTGNDLSGNNYISGTAYLYNDYSANGIYTPLVNHSIDIQYSSGPAIPNYLYTVNSDSNGNFIFPNLANNVPYTIFAQDTVSGIQFFGAILDTLKNDKNPIVNAVLTLKLDSIHQNGIIYTVTDSSGNIITGCSICVYSSPLLAAQGMALDSCLGCTFQMLTNTFGKASQFNVPAGHFTTVLFAKFDSIVLTGDTVLTIPTFGIVRDTVLIGRH